MCANMSEVARRVFTEISEHHTYVMLYQLQSPLLPLATSHITSFVNFSFGYRNKTNLSGGETEMIVVSCGLEEQRVYRCTRNSAVLS